MYPKPERNELIKYNFRQWRYNRDSSDGGIRSLAPFDRKRLLFVTTVLKEKVGHISIEDLLNGKIESPESGPMKEVHKEYLLCAHEALECYMDNVDGVSRDILHSYNRIGKPEVERVFVEIMASVREVATATAGEMLWFKQVSSQVEIAKLDTQAARRAMLTDVVKRYPKAYEMVSESQRPERSQWEVAVGRALEQRLCEHVLEEDHLSKKATDLKINLS